MKKILTVAVLFIITLQFTSCSDIDITAAPGASGMSAYAVWVKAVESGAIQWTSGTDMANYFKFIQGEKGQTALPAYEVWKDFIKTGTVDDPHKPDSKWDPKKNSEADYYYFLTGAKGEAAITPHINDKGNWQIGDKDTGMPAKGESGSKVIIASNGNWEIDGKDTGISAKGKEGGVGADGKTAYEIWVAEVEAGKIFDNNGDVWPVANNTLIDFWDYLSAGATPLGITKFSFVKSGLDPTDNMFEIFEFLTEEGAVVQMTSGQVKITAVANETGQCFIRFPNSSTTDLPALASAQKTGKYMSQSILVPVKAQPAIFKLADEALWYGPDGLLLTEPHGEYRPNDNPVFLSLKDSRRDYTVSVPFEAENIQDVVLIGGNSNNASFSIIWEPGSQTKGYLLLTKTRSAGWGPGVLPVTIQIVSKSKAFSFISMEVTTLN